MKVLITDLRHYSIDEERRVLEPLGLEITVSFSETEEELIKNGKDAVGFLVSYAKITRRVMEALPELRIIVKYGVGVDNIDLAAAHELGKYVANVPDYCIEEVALHTLSLTLAGLKRSFYFSEQVKRKNWLSDPGPEQIFRFSSTDLGLIGFGRISRKFAYFMERMVNRIYFYDPYVKNLDLDNKKYIHLESLEELIKRVKTLSIHVPFTAETENMINWENLCLADGIILVNTSRAGIVDKYDLERALEAGRVIFYASDVFWYEPPDYRDTWQKNFIGRKDVLITPHSAWYSVESERDVRRMAAEEIARVVQGHAPRNNLSRE